MKNKQSNNNNDEISYIQCRSFKFREALNKYRHTIRWFIFRFDCVGNSRNILDIPANSCLAENKFSQAVHIHYLSRISLENLKGEKQKMYPRLTINLQKLIENGEKLCAKAAEKGIHNLAFVTKCFCADRRIVQAMEDLSNPYLADSRIENLKRLAFSRKKKILLRLPMLSEVDDAVYYADISFCSESVTLDSLNYAAARQGKRHQVVLMVDMGDLREGVFFRNLPELMCLVEQIEQAQHLDLYGMAFNVTCYGSVIPTQQTLEDFLKIVRHVEAKIGRKLPFVSAGNSSSLELLYEGDLSGFNNLRIGEGLLFGREAAHCHYLPGLHNDVFVLEAQVIEAKRKPSYPIGERGVNAFGKRVEYIDRGTRLRLLAAVGQQDIEFSDLIPITPGVEVVGASSDHLILDNTQLLRKVGDVVCFRMNYTAAMRAFTSSYVEKKFN